MPTRNTDPEFVGIAALKQRHAEQLREFEKSAARHEWVAIHDDHYDWWMFPINKPSSYAFGWTVFDGDIDELKTDAEFMTHYRRGLELVALAWGWDLAAAREVANPEPGQAWAHWPVRLHKMTISAKLFGEEAAHQSLRTYGQILIARKCDMTFRGKDLSGTFK